MNKYWECDPVCWALTNNYLRSNCALSSSFWPALQHYPVNGVVQPQPTQPRLVFHSATTQVEVWCISDLMSQFPSDEQSSSEYKMKVLKHIFAGSPVPVSLVVAVGTASSGTACPPFQGAVQTNINGSVVVGSKIFMHDAHPQGSVNPQSQWRCGYFDKLMNSTASAAGLVRLQDFDALELALLWPPNNPAPNQPRIYVNDAFVALGDINVTDYKEYAIKDAETGDAFAKHCPGNQHGVSLETTHGLIYATAREHVQGDPPFLFVSGVVDRYTLFATDVASKVYAQNVTGAHNAGVVITEMVAALLGY